jgi:hypothetical protein
MGEYLKRLERNSIDIIKSNPKDKNLILKHTNNSIKILEYIDKSLLKDKEFVEKIIGINGLALKYMPEKFRADKVIVIKALKNSAGFALKYASENLRADREVVIESIKHWRAPLNYASEELQKEFNEEINNYYKKHKI